jgi:hypothetical protein
MLRAGRQGYPQVLRRTLSVHPSLQEKQGQTPSKFPAATGSGTHASSRPEDTVAVATAELGEGYYGHLLATVRCGA